MRLKLVFAVAALACWLMLAWYAIAADSGLVAGLVTGIWLLGAMSFVIWAGRVEVHFSLRDMLIAITFVALVLGNLAALRLW